MQQRRNRVVWWIAIGVAFFFLVDPFRLFQSKNMPETRASSEIQAEMRAFIAQAPTAIDFVVDLLRDYDLVMIGETGFVAQQLEFLSQLIPRLDAAGVRHLGYQYANAGDQALIDRLVSGDLFDEALARRILFNHMVILGYQEHLDVFRAAWQVNRTRRAGESPFRIIGVGMRPDYEAIRTQQDADDPAVLRTVFADGVPDRIMTDTILQEIVRPGHKAVVYTQIQHAFTGFDQATYRTMMAERGFPGSERAGNALRRELDARVVSAIFHSPFQDSRSRTGYGYPVGGLMERAIKTLPADSRSRGFLTAQAPYAEAPITGDSITKGLEEELTLSAFADGYLTLGEIASYRGVTPIPGFITAENVDEARRLFPGPDPGEVTVEQLNEYIAGNAASAARVFEQFK